MVDLFRQRCERGMLASSAKTRRAQAELRQIEARVVELLPIGSTVEYEGGEVASATPARRLVGFGLKGLDRSRRRSR